MTTPATPPATEPQCKDCGLLIEKDRVKFLTRNGWPCVRCRTCSHKHRNNPRCPTCHQPTTFVLGQNGIPDTFACPRC